jgi:lysophospholipase L1-like esterase
MRIAFFGFYALVLPLYAGFFFYESTDPLVFGYSLSYLIFVSVLGSFLTVPLFVWLSLKLLGAKRTIFLGIALLMLALPSYCLVAIVYYNNQERDFDPFLQIDNPRFTGIAKHRSEDDTSLRILVLGGSTSMGYPVFMGDQLRERSEGRFNVEILNGSMRWYTTRHSLINYVSYCADWSPDVVVVMHGINDLVRSFDTPSMCIGSYDELYTHWYGPMVTAARPPSIEHRLLSPLCRNWYRSHRVKSADCSMEKFRSLPSFRRNLEKLAQIATKDGAVVLVVSQPTVFKPSMSREEIRLLGFGEGFCLERESYFKQSYPNHESLYRAMIEYNNASRDVAANEKLEFVDAAPVVPRTKKHFVDDCHCSEAGLRLLANSVTDAIVQTSAWKQRVE